MKWAITPNGVGNYVGARAINDDWPLARGETFKVDDWRPNFVLAADGVSLQLGEPPAPTIDQIYEELLQNQRLLKGLTLSLNDGSFVPGSNRTPMQLRNIIKTKL